MAFTLLFVAGMALWFFLGFLVGAGVSGAGWPLILGGMGIAGVTFLWSVKRI